MRKVLIILAALVMIGGGIYLALWQGSKAKKTASSPSPTAEAPGSQPIVRFNGTAFSPASYTAKAGTMIVFFNTSQQPLQLDSDPHPVHTDNPELNVGEIAPGTSKSATLSKTGTWGYHNHLNPSEKGTITVQ